jgi:glutamate dehydrogenase/leucine dehydrogenase
MSQTPFDRFDFLLSAWDGEELAIRALPRLHAWIFTAFHSHALGPATGGTRLQRYASLVDALADALKLSEAMTFKLAVAGLPCGGGKAVIAVRDPPSSGVRAELLEAYAEMLAAFDGRFQTGPDVNTTPNDMDVLARRTPHVFCRSEANGGSGDSGPHTARGVLHAMRASVARAFESTQLTERTVLVQGLGSVGSCVARLAAAEGARVAVCDIDRDRARNVAMAVDAEVVNAHRALDRECDVYSPCALGGTLSAATIPRLRCRVIAGAANNQLATPEDGDRLREAGILYAPDFVANAGGVLYAIGTERLGWRRAQADAAISNIADTLAGVFWGDASARPMAHGNPITSNAGQRADAIDHSPSVGC